VGTAICSIVGDGIGVSVAIGSGVNVGRTGVKVGRTGGNVGGKGVTVGGKGLDIRLQLKETVTYTNAMMANPLDFFILFSF
jgi:hypothetical protein